MSFLESIIYGFVSGLTELIPVSTQGHQALMLRLFGLSVREPVRDMFVHIAILIALMTTCRSMFTRITAENRLSSRSKNRRTAVRRGAYDLRLIKSAIFPLVVGTFFYFTTRKVEANYILLALMFIINGVIILIPEYARHGNKDTRFMSGWDGIVFGILGALAVVPGISRVGTMDFYMTLRGVDRKNTINWILMLSVPVLFILIFIDLILLFILPLGKISFVIFIQYIVSAVAAYCGSYLSIVLVKYLSVHTGYSAFAYYSWGTAMFTFVLYLIA